MSERKTARLPSLLAALQKLVPMHVTAEFVPDVDVYRFSTPDGVFAEIEKHLIVAATTRREFHNLAIVLLRMSSQNWAQLLGRDATVWR